ncbi:MAG TPA: hypothetical protein VK745_08360 [Polyangiaceae bacterium]|jgi:hypothetical protein|nr:hypothetical protein [Polyangiaceae bacterium]
MSTDAHSVDTDTEVEATQPDKINTGALGTLVVVGLLAMISITAAVTALVRHDIDEEQSEKDADANQVVIALKNQQRGVLNGPAGYVDRTKGIVSLPIDIAKQLVVSELQRDPNSATPPAPPAAASAASAAAPADAAAAPATDGKKPEETGKSENDQKGAGAKPETGKEHATMAPAKPAQPSSPPLTPTAASPGAKAPGPLKN